MVRGMTLGVRAACFDESGHVFLVRHTYLPGWHLPGGGVERGETVLDALAKEMQEEGNLVAISPPEFVHVYFNKNASRKDHVLLYKVQVKQTVERKGDREIAETGFFSLDALPLGTTQSTKTRLLEVLNDGAPSNYW